GTPVEAIAREAGVALGKPRDADFRQSPGMIESHYAPRKPMRLLSGPLTAVSDREVSAKGSLVGLLAQSGDEPLLRRELERRTGARAIVEVLSPSGDRSEAARHLFAAMRRLDSSDADVLLAEPCTDEEGLGYAISDRLRRACHENRDNRQ